MSGPAQARAQDSNPTVSERVVRFALLLHGEQVMEAAAKRDDMVTVEIDDRGHYGFLPEVQGDGTVLMEIYSLEAGPRRLVETVLLDYGKRVQLAADSSLALTLSEITVTRTAIARPAREFIRLASLGPVAFRSFALGSMDCCIRCGNVTTCGCAVTMSCGCCCSDGCTNQGCTELECNPEFGFGTGKASGECGLKFEGLVAALAPRGE